MRQRRSFHTTRQIETCPYCRGNEISRKGLRKNKYGDVQLFFCRRCNKKFTPLLTKNKTFPLRIIIDSLSLYNRLYSLDDAARAVTEKYGLPVSRQNISNWLADFRVYLPIARLRPALARRHDTYDLITEAQLLHGQVYAFKYHHAKTDLILDRLRARHPFTALQEYLANVPRECPHSLFRENRNRASSHKGRFDIDGVIITPRKNTAVSTARFALQAVANNKLRHETLQNFMLVNDSVTIAAEVPVYLTADDLNAIRKTSSQLPFTLARGECITGHIDLVQLRYGLIHILDYKPDARRIRPIEQLTIYALALSRLTGIKLYHFKCAWFDDEDYFDFFPRTVIRNKSN